MHFRRAEKKQEGGAKAELSDKLLESRRVLKNDKLSPSDLFSAVHSFCDSRKEHNDKIVQIEAAIENIFRSFSPQERDEFFSMLYDEFAETYDEHMGVETGHYHAMRALAFTAGFHLRAPVLDITAGTGELMSYAIDCMETAEVMRASEYMRKKMAGFPQLESCMDYDNGLEYLFYVNEISPRMLEKARKKMTLGTVRYLRESAYSLPEELKGKINTVLCSQTFHLISEEDKTRLVISMREMLAPGGVAVVMEEDPFRITTTPQIEPVAMFLRSVISPIKHRERLIGMFATNGFEKLEEGAKHPIDEHHVMRLHLFRKS